MTAAVTEAVITAVTEAVITAVTEWRTEAKAVVATGMPVAVAASITAMMNTVVAASKTAMINAAVATDMSTAYVVTTNVLPSALVAATAMAPVGGASRANAGQDQGGAQCQDSGESGK